MHAEFIDVTEGFIETLATNINGPVISVGTTSLRTIETLYWMGVKLTTALLEKKIENIHVEEISIHQWDAYELPQHIETPAALRVLLQWMAAQGIQRLITKTQIIIAPGYTLRVAKGLVTNFHQPQSTLLLLVAAIIGDDWRKVYNYALQHNYRFLSYGDGSLLFKQ